MPQVRTEDWALKVHGMVDQELDFLRDLLARDLVERDITLTCVSNEVGGAVRRQRALAGAPLADLLTEAGVRAAPT